MGEKPSAQSQGPSATELTDVVNTENFQRWYDRQETEQHFLDGQPYFVGVSPPPDAERHTPSKLLKCHRQTAYYKENAPKESAAPTGLFWVGSKIEEEVVVPFLQDVVSGETFVQNSLWISAEFESPGQDLLLKGVTDPAIVTRSGEPLVVTEIKSTTSIEYRSEPSRHHKAQLMSYLVALNREYEREVDDGLLIYVDRVTFDLKVFEVSYDEEFWEEQVLPWMSEQTEYRAAGELPPAEPVESWECDHCPFSMRCGEDEDSTYSDVGFTGLLPRTSEYREGQLIDYLEAHDGALLTPTLAHEYPELAAEYCVLDWECPECGGVRAFEDTDWSPGGGMNPVCEDCTADDGLQLMQVPRPDDQLK